MFRFIPKRNNLFAVSCFIWLLSQKSLSPISLDLFPKSDAYNSKGSRRNAGPDYVLSWNTICLWTSKECSRAAVEQQSASGILRMPSSNSRLQLISNRMIARCKGLLYANTDGVTSDGQACSSRTECYMENNNGRLVLGKSSRWTRLEVDHASRSPGLLESLPVT